MSIVPACSTASQIVVTSVFQSAGSPVLRITVAILMYSFSVYPLLNTFPKRRSTHFCQGHFFSTFLMPPFSE